MSREEEEDNTLVSEIVYVDWGAPNRKGDQEAVVGRVDNMLVVLGKNFEEARGLWEGAKNAKGAKKGAEGVGTVAADNNLDDRAALDSEDSTALIG